MGGGTQATVWHAIPSTPGKPEAALRLTPKPVALISRIGRLVNAVEGVQRPETLAVAGVEHGGRPWTTWIGEGPARRSTPYRLGRDIAHLHEELARHGGSTFADRLLSFERGPIPSSEQPPPAWYVARHRWRDRISLTYAAQQRHLRAQPIHGDLHWDNVVVGRDGGFGFIDFDKVMHAPPACAPPDSSRSHPKPVRCVFSERVPPNCWTATAVSDRSPTPRSPPLRDTSSSSTRNAHGSAMPSG
ncbi:phosphotransferase [Nonomuraea rosea]|uniref:phosphotransferase n=1 Tax=Nonomuraea rosea TaxID=638574 RepID=UPI0031EDB0E2